MLGDITISEPGALIGFAGPRVIKETIKRDLPKGFQTAEFVLEHGFLDFISHRKELKDKSNRPVKIIPKSDDPPQFKGESWGWETKGGRYIRYPSAYRKIGWSNMMYRQSTLHIEVGEKWCIDKIYNDYKHWIYNI